MELKVFSRVRILRPSNAWLLMDCDGSLPSSLLVLLAVAATLHGSDPFKISLFLFCSDVYLSAFGSRRGG